MNYINYKYNGTIETVDQFETRKEAKEMLNEYRMAYGPGSELWLSSRSTKEWRESELKSLTLRDQLQKRFGLKKSDFSSYCSDLHVLIEDTEKREKVINWLKSQKMSVYKVWSDVEGQPWFGKMFLDIPFRA